VGSIADPRRNAVAQYSPKVAAQFANVKKTPEQFLLWFHHLPGLQDLVRPHPWDELHRYTTASR
jgi:alpha-glucuronidase